MIAQEEDPGWAQQMLADINSIPEQLCDAPGCRRPALNYISQHSCEEAHMCGLHGQHIYDLYARTLIANGFISCKYCGRAFSDLQYFVSARPI